MAVCYDELRWVLLGRERYCLLWGRGRAWTEDVSAAKVKGVQGVVSDIFVSL